MLYPTIVLFSVLLSMPLLVLVVNRVMMGVEIRRLDV